MNWKEIAEKYPKAYHALIYENGDIQRLVYSAIDGSPSEHWDGRTFNRRDLYDFFDEHAVFVKVSYNSVTLDFYYRVIIDYSSSLQKERYYPSRSEAETAAFTKAFEILEQTLNLI